MNKIDKQELRNELLRFKRPGHSLTRYEALADKVLRGTVLSAIRMKCLDCCCGSKKEIRECQIKSCSLWAFRMGKNPFRKKRSGPPSGCFGKQQDQEEETND